MNSCGTSLRRLWPTVSIAHARARLLSSSCTKLAHRDYAEAIAVLNGLQSNYATVEALRKNRQLQNKNAIPEMVDWWRRVGYEPEDLDLLNILHIAGTKGKGSTSAFVSSILAEFMVKPGPEKQRLAFSSAGLPTRIGLYTSPHLRSVRERIQINNKPISEVLFARYFFDVWDRLDKSARERGLSEAETKARPVYFRFLTLLAFHVYLSEGVDTAVVECGIGGEYDSTNIVQRPSICAVTNLGIDHTPLLGNTVEEIAWHKAGIFKSEAAIRQVFTVESQPPEAAKVLRQRAQDKGLELVTVPIRQELRDGLVDLPLAGNFQRDNASLAMAVATAYLQHRGVERLPGLHSARRSLMVKRGLDGVKLAGRCEKRVHERFRYWIDGAHTRESIENVAQWFGSQIPSSQSEPTPSAQGDAISAEDAVRDIGERRVLIFNQQKRDAPALVRALHETISQTRGSKQSANGKPPELPLFHRAIFCTNITFAENSGVHGGYKPDLQSINESDAGVRSLSVQKELAEVWKTLDPLCEIFTAPSIEDAVSLVGRLSKQDASTTREEVLVTGSMHLVGGLLEVVETYEAQSTDSNAETVAERDYSTPPEEHKELDAAGWESFLPPGALGPHNVTELP